MSDQSVNTPSPAAPETTEPKADNTVVPTGKDPVTGDTAKSAAQEVMRKHKLKVAGQEVEVDDEELKRGYSISKAAAKEMFEAKRIAKQAQEFIDMGKDPTKVIDLLKHLGHDARKLAEEYLASQLEDDLKDPKDKELQKYKSEAEQYRQMIEAEKERKAKIQSDALKQKYAKEYEAQFTEALQSSKLPATKESVAKMARYIHRASEINLEMTPQEAAQLVKEDMTREIKTLVAEASPETLIALFGEETANKIRGWDTSRVKDPNKGLENPTHANPQKERRNTTKPMSHDEWREFNRK